MMDVVDALQVLVEARRDDAVVIAQMGSAREWPRLSRHRLDFIYAPSAMGGGPPLGLGIALAQPDRPVTVISGDGSLLMSLGCLVSIVASGVKNYSLVLLDNGVYEITGGQRTAAGPATDFAGFARAAGFPSVARFDRLDAWREGAAEILASPGPRFIWLKVEPVRDDYGLSPPLPMKEQAARFRQALEAAQH